MSEKKTLGRRPRDCSIPRTFTPLALETRTHITTAEAAHHFDLSEQTLRGWACFADGPIKPTRIKGSSLLRWPVAEIKRVILDEQSADPVARSRRSKAVSAQAVARGVEWKSLALHAIGALEKWERAAKGKDRDEMDAARKTRDAVLKDFRAKTGGAA